MTTTISQRKYFDIEDGYILLVEQHEDLGTLLVEIIQKAFPHRLILVSEPRQALDLAQQKKPCLFLLDGYLGWTYQRDEITGIHLYQALHALKERADVPAIVMIDRFQQTITLREQTVIWFDKDSFDIDELLKAINDALSQQSEARQAA